MNFVNFVANIALLILFISLSSIGYVMYKSRNKFVGENVVIGECPDYWNMVKQGNTNVCVNVKNLGNSSCSRTPDSLITDGLFKKNFFVQPYTNTDSMCQKSKWANSCDLTWDGITNNPNACKKK